MKTKTIGLTIVFSDLTISELNYLENLKVPNRYELSRLEGIAVQREQDGRLTDLAQSIPVDIARQYQIDEYMRRKAV